MTEASIPTEQTNNNASKHVRGGGGRGRGSGGRGRGRGGGRHGRGGRGGKQQHVNRSSKEEKPIMDNGDMIQNDVNNNSNNNTGNGNLIVSSTTSSCDTLNNKGIANIDHHAIDNDKKKDVLSKESHGKKKKKKQSSHKKTANTSHIIDSNNNNNENVQYKTNGSVDHQLGSSIINDMSSEKNGHANANDINKNNDNDQNDNNNRDDKNKSIHREQNGGRGRGGRGRRNSHGGRGRGKGGRGGRGEDVVGIQLQSNVDEETSTKNDNPTTIEQEMSKINLNSELPNIDEEIMSKDACIAINGKTKQRKHGRNGKIRKQGNNIHQPNKVTELSSNESNNDNEEVKQILGIPIKIVSNGINSSVTTQKNNAGGQMHRIDSTTSLISEKSEKDAKAGSVGNIDLLKNMKKGTSKKKKDKDSKTKSKPPKPKRGEKQQKQQNDEISKQRAAKAFNSAVRKCVERSDPDGLHDLLHEKRNHKYALHADVLETVLKAYVVAAMFDEALYCCKHCTKPGTLSTLQTEKILQCLPQNMRNSNAYVAADMINALCIATEFDKPTHRTYFMRIVRGIALEFLEEVINARDRICSAPCERLVRSAVCVVDARLRRGKKAADLVVMPGKQLGVFVPDSSETRGIQAGDAVGILPYAGPYPMSAESLDRNMIEATVTGVQPMVLRLQDKTNAALYATLTEPSEGNVYRIDKLANRMGFNRQLSAAVAIASPLEKDVNGVAVPTRCDMRRPSPELIKAITAMDESIDNAMFDGNVSSQYRAGRLTSTAALCAQPVPFYTAEDSCYDYNGEIKRQDQYDEDSIRDAARLALEKYGSFDGLNASQRLAVEGAATNRLTLVQGPPGTGKTAVAIRIIQHWARLASSEALPGQNPKPILATSDSNIAVDNLVEGCANVGLKVIRLGRPEAIRPELLRFCIDRPQNNRSQNNGDDNVYGGNNYTTIYKEKLKALKSAQVICCTCIGSGADILDSMTFERVLVDEATQATEPAVLVPLTRLCRQLVLVGDHCQLPPTVLSTRAEEEGLGVPLFSRMVACGVPPFMLDTQYRMHPSIAMFPSDLFYGGKLLNGVSAPERRPLAGFPWPREEFPVAFVPVPLGIEIDDGVSKMNEAEAAAACDAVEALLKGGQCNALDIAVVTPYAAQVRLIRRLTRKLVNGPPYVEVSSTDGFQGREKEAVVFSAVRSNDYGSVGFVSDWRRVNVSFTRARRGLIVIGNDITLRRGDPDTWMPWLEWVNAHGVNMDSPGKTRGRYDAEQLRRVRGGTTAAEMLKDVLERQQMQLQKAEKQIENAQKKSSGQILGEVDGLNNDIKNTDNMNESLTKNESQVSLQNDLALLSNADGNWDDSDDEDCNNIQNSASVAELTSLTSSSGTKFDEPQDAWDLEYE